MNPQIKSFVFEHVKAVSLFEKSDKLNQVLQRFLQEGDKKLGPTLFSYAANVFMLRYRNYSIVPLPERNLECDFSPAKEIFSPFHFHINDVLREEYVEKGGKGYTRFTLVPNASVGSHVILFQTSPNVGDIKKALSVLRKAGVKSVVCFFIVSDI